MGRLILFGLMLVYAGSASAQFDTSVNLKQQTLIEGNYKDFYVDNLNNIYLINSDNQLKKFDDKGDSITVSNALRKYGDINLVDVSNPLKIIVFYKDYSTIVVLDRFLSNQNTIDLRKYGIFEAQAAAQSYDNNYWVFDAVENKLKKIDDNGNILLQTPDFRTIFNEAFPPEKIIDNDGLLYLYNKQNGWLIFDYYGGYKQYIHQPGLNNVQVIKKDLYGFDSAQNMHRYNIKTFKESTYHFITNTIVASKIQLRINNIYILTKDALYSSSIAY